MSIMGHYALQQLLVLIPSVVLDQNIHEPHYRGGFGSFEGSQILCSATLPIPESQTRISTNYVSILRPIQITQIILFSLF